MGHLINRLLLVLLLMVFSWGALANEPTTKASDSEVKTEIATESDTESDTDTDTDTETDNETDTEGGEKSIDKEEESPEIFNFFKQRQMTQPRLAPGGKLVAYYNNSILYVGSKEVPFNAVADFDNGRINDITWVSDQAILVKWYTKGVKPKYHKRFIEIIYNEVSKTYKPGKGQYLKSAGYLLDPLVNDPDHVLYAVYRRNSRGLFTDVHKLNIFDESLGNALDKKRRINNQTNILYWMLNKDKELTAGLSIEDRQYSLLLRKYSTSRRLIEVWQTEGADNLVFSPVGLSTDEKTLYILTNYQRDTVSLMTFDIETKQLDKLLFTLPGIDLKAMHMDPVSNTPLYVGYLEKGEVRYHFLNARAEQDYQQLKTIIPNQELHLIDESEDTQQHLVMSQSAQNLGRLHLCDKQDNRCVDLGSAFPWLDGYPLASSEVLQVKTRDDQLIDSFLTIPAKARQVANHKDKIPLIVMPHGGPIGVADMKSFHGDTQWLAYNGYAVLQVNFRGSGGYGKAFELKGMGELGRGIEDDIDDALALALKTYPQLNDQRMCIFGSSYGGYSSLISVIRHPQMYRCAVSFAGVMDLSLLFNKSSVQNNQQLSQWIKKLVGDPKTHMADLKDYSPVYQYKKITTPVMLIHGTHDTVVDVEHSWRLHQMLELNQLKHEFVVLDEFGHGFDNVGEIKQFYDHIMPFLQQHLVGEATP